MSCRSSPPPSAVKWEEDWLPVGAEQQGSREITDFPVISLPLFRLAPANFPVSTQAANLTLPAQSHSKTHTHTHQEAHTGVSSRFWVIRAPWHNSAAATRSHLEEGAATQLSISSAPRSKARGGLGKMLPDSQQACCPCFLKHWALNPHMPRQHSCMATSAISSCPRQFPSLLELLWSRFVRAQAATAEVAVVPQRVTMSTPPGGSSSLFLRHGYVAMSQRAPGSLALWARHRHS